MNIDYANTIPMPEILSKLGLQPVQQNSTGPLYPSPFHDAETLCLQIIQADNSWHDPIKNTGGGPVAFVQAWLQRQQKRCALPDALHWIKFNIGYPSLLPFLDLPEDKPQAGKYKVTYKTKLQEGGLLRYAANRGIRHAAARHLFKQLYVFNEDTGREFLALGFRNEDGGFAVYNPETEILLRPAGVTVIRGAQQQAKTIHVFKDVFDYWQSIRSRHYEAFNGDCIILNSYACIDQAPPYIRGFGFRRLYTWFDTGNTGKEATDAFAWLCTTEQDLEHHIVQQPLTTS